MRAEDYDNAMKILFPLADNGNAIAQCNVAILFFAGLGAEVDCVQAVKWYRKAAEQNIVSGNISGLAYHNLSAIFAHGAPGVSADPELAALYLKRAAALGVDFYRDRT